MEHNVVHKDCLLIPPSGKSLKKKSWQQKCGKLFGASKFGTKRLEIWEQDLKSKSTPVAIIQLDNCVKITSEDDTHFTLTLTTDPFVYEFGTLTPASKTKWLSSLQTLVFPENLDSLTVEEDNELYCSSDGAVFFVTIAPSVASQRCQIDHNTNYILQLGSNSLELKMCDGTLLYTWPYCFIRRYGYKNNKFTFEAGRKCDSGEGIFFVEHSNQQEIFRCLSSKIKEMKKVNQSKVAVPVKPPRKSLPVKQVPSYDSVEYKLEAWRTHGVDDVTHTEFVNDDQEEQYMSWGSETMANRKPVAMATGNAPKIVTQRPVDQDNYNKLDFFGSSSKLNASSNAYKTIAFNEYAEVQCDEADDTATDINYHFQNNQPYAIVNKPKKN